MKNFLLIDDHAVVRNGVKYLLTDLYPDCNVDEAENEAQAIESVKDNSYDLIFLDINIPQTNTLDLLKYILNIKPEIKVLMFSMNAEKLYAKRYLEAGAKGFISKDAPVDELKRAINIVLNNKNYYSEAFIDTIMSGKTGKNNNPIENLSQREFEIYNLLAAGKSLTEISELLDIHKSTLGTHKAKILSKLNLRNMFELIEFAKLNK